MKPIIRASLLTTVLALSFNLAGCGGSSTVVTPAQTTALAFNETGDNVYDLKNADGGKLEIHLQSGAARKVLAFAEDMKEFKLTIYNDYKSYDYTLYADEYGNAKASFLNLTPGIWHVRVTGVDRTYKEVGTKYADVTIRAYEVAYTTFTLTLNDTLLNQDTGALQASVITDSGDINQSYYPEVMMTAGDWAPRGNADHFSYENFTGAYTAFSTYDKWHPTSKKGVWEGRVEFSVGRVDEMAYLFATLEDGKHYPLGKMLVSWDDLGLGNSTNFINLDDLNLDDMSPTATIFDLDYVYKAAYPETIVTDYHPYGIQVQRYMVVQPDEDDYGNDVGVMSSLYFQMVDGKPGPLIAADFTDKAGIIGSDPNYGNPNGPHYNVVHIHALDK